MTGQDAAQQATRSLQNMQAIAEAAGTDFGRALKLTVLLSDIHDYDAVDEVFQHFFDSESYPVRTVMGG